MLTRDRGMTFSELLIGLALGALVMTAVLNSYIRLGDQSRFLITQARVYHDLDSLLSLMTHDIRRAGFWQNDNPALVRDNPFTGNMTNLNTGRYSNADPPASCLTYSYDLNRDGLFNQGNSEFFGYRLRNGAVEMRTGGSDYNCRQGSWQKITTARTIITGLSFAVTSKSVNPLSTTNNCSGNTCQQMRLVNISLTGYPDRHPDESVTLSTVVLVRNNRVTG